MIKITVELLPFGFEENKKTLGIMKIWNDITGTKTKGNYQFSISKNNEPNQIWKRGFINGFPRKRLGSWDLLYRCLKIAVYDRNIGS